MSLLVASIPKSGTYLLREILTRAGLECDSRHVPQKHTGPIDIQGDFRVGHPPYDPTHYGHKVIFLYRNIRTVFISSIKYAMQIGQRPTKDITPEYVCRLLSDKHIPLKHSRLMPWFDHADFSIRFEDLNNPILLSRLLTDVTGSKGYTITHTRDIFDVAYNTKTITWSGTSKRTDWRDFWSEDVEHLWKQSHLYRMNEVFGYE